jgi:hypothetical protein
MKRIAVIGALVLILAMFAGPAFAAERGSVLPGPGPQQVLPRSSGSSGSTATQYSTQPLADTGLGLTNGALLGIGLLAAGGTALAISRRRAAA